MPEITLTVPDTKWEEYKKYFLMAYPNQAENLSEPLTDNQWIKHRIFLFAKGAYKRGKRQEFDEQNEPVFDEEIITQ